MEEIMLHQGEDERMNVERKISNPRVHLVLKESIKKLRQRSPCPFF